MADLETNAGHVARIKATFTNPDDDSYVTPATVTFRVLLPDGQTIDYVYGIDTEVSLVSTGIYRLRLEVDLPGVYYVNAFTAGTGKAAQSAVIVVEPDPTAANGSQVTGTGTVYDEEGVVEEGASVSMQIVSGPGGAGLVGDAAVRTESSGVDGTVSFSGLFVGAKYRYWRGDSTTPRRDRGRVIEIADHGSGQMTLPTIRG
jgi:hypothetical protein